MPIRDLCKRICDYGATVPGVDETSLRACLAMRQFYWEGYTAMDKHLSKYGLSASRFKVLQDLFHHPEQTMTPAELAEGIHQTRAAMTSTLDGLEKQGFVTRAAHPTDRRRTCVILTPAGREHIGGLVDDHYREVTTVMKYVTEDEMATLIELHAKVGRGIAELVAGPETVRE